MLRNDFARGDKKAAQSLLHSLVAACKPLVTGLAICVSTSPIMIDCLVIKLRKRRCLKDYENLKFSLSEPKLLIFSPQTNKARSRKLWLCKFIYVRSNVNSYSVLRRWWTLVSEKRVYQHSTLGRRVSDEIRLSYRRCVCGFFSKNKMYDFGK